MKIGYLNTQKTKGGLNGAYKVFLKQGTTLEAACAKNNISQSTLYRYIRSKLLPTRQMVND